VIIFVFDVFETGMAHTGVIFIAILRDGTPQVGTRIAKYTTTVATVVSPAGEERKGCVAILTNLRR
jgi:hypothetical protein